MASFTLTVSSVDQIHFAGSVESVHVTATTGELTVLANHEPLVTTLAAGEVVVRPVNGAEQRIEVAGGVLEVAQNNATILV